MEIGNASAAELGRAIGNGALDPVELAQEYLARIARADPDGQIYARLTPERALAEASAARDRARSGARRSALDGVPASWKDLFDSAGTRTEAGSPFLRGRIPQADAALLARATQAGMVCLGKTHQTELAFSGLGVNPNTATPPNAVMPGHAPGGSSSGAAASLAHALAPLAMGSDTGGSVRIPAAWNNLAGLKVTFGALPGEGMVPLCPTFDTPGPLARDVEDLRLAFDVLRGEDGFAPAPAAPAAAGLHLLVAEGVALEECDNEVRSAFDAAVARLVKAGARVDRGPVPQLAQSMELTGPLFGYEAWQGWKHLIEARGDEMFAPIRTRFQGGGKFTSADNAAAMEAMRRLRGEYARHVEAYDAVLTPTVAILPPVVDAVLADHDHFAARNALCLRNTRFANTLGVAALSLPLPQAACGLQLMGKAHGEARLLAVGAALERPARG